MRFDCVNIIITQVLNLENFQQTPSPKEIFPSKKRVKYLNSSSSQTLITFLAPHKKQMDNGLTVSRLLDSTITVKDICYASLGVILSGASFYSVYRLYQFFFGKKKMVKGDFKKLGYSFNVKGEFVDEFGRGFVWENEEGYQEALGVLREYVEDSLKILTFQRIDFQQDGEGTVPIYVTPDYLKNDKIMVVIPGKTCANIPGVWSAYASITDSVHTGTMIPYLKNAGADDFGIILSNPYTSHSERNGSPVAHIRNILDMLIENDKTDDIVILANGYGGICAVSLLQYKQYHEKLRGIGFIDSSHSINLKRTDDQIQKFLSKRTRNWVPSEAPLGNPVQDPVYEYTGCFCVSAGTSVHTEAPYEAMTDVLGFLRETIDKRNQHLF
eukprot:TRINITY_DN949_c0_g1_i1.p1 TRINITY_DN949_c0_g1~~TRINITY_DN949_c0_g1_i1.p1  ORF type:complete len:384 (-),score=66.41 TRINITY_DN949_c0_g1_i1:64-1215(-)